MPIIEIATYHCHYVYCYRYCHRCALAGRPTYAQFVCAIRIIMIISNSNNNNNNSNNNDNSNNNSNNNNSNNNNNVCIWIALVASRLDVPSLVSLLRATECQEVIEYYESESCRR